MTTTTTRMSQRVADDGRLAASKLGTMRGSEIDLCAVATRLLLLLLPAAGLGLVPLLLLRLLLVLFSYRGREHHHDVQDDRRGAQRHRRYENSSILRDRHAPVGDAAPWPSSMTPPLPKPSSWMLWWSSLSSLWLPTRRVLTAVVGMAMATSRSASLSVVVAKEQTCVDTTRFHVECDVKEWDERNPPGQKPVASKW